MLLCLRVRNFAIIDELEVGFGQGLNVVTGETGAGKSILVDALQLVLGGKSKAEVVRTGADSAEVEALFDVADDPEVQARMHEAGLDADDGELVVRRVIQASGRSRAYANGRLTAAAQLSKLAAGLADVSSQHEHHTLVHPSSHLSFLDAFGKLDGLREEVRLAHERLIGATRELQMVTDASRQRMEREDLLRFQVQEIDEVDPRPDELEALQEERDRHRHAERLLSTAGGAEDALYASDDALCARLARVVDDVERAAALDSQLQPLAEQLAAARAQLEEAGRDLGHYARHISADPERLAEVETRLDKLDRLQRKYGGDLDKVRAHRDTARQELDALDNSEERIRALEEHVEDARMQAGRAAKKLSAARKKAATRLGKAVGEQLGSLGMGDAQVRVEVERAAAADDALTVDGARLSPTGIDRVEFLIATNRGEAPQPLRKIASGGELSRAMLAIKRVLAGLGPAGLYVFDEVDSGVGGAVAEVIGHKLEEVAQHHQVLCITHLPQIAAFADTHFQVSKHVSDGRTRSEITSLDKTERKQEIARMLGGMRITDKTRAAAREMLRSAGHA